MQQFEPETQAVARWTGGRGVSVWALSMRVNKNGFYMGFECDERRNFLTVLERSLILRVFF